MAGFSEYFQDFDSFTRECKLTPKTIACLKEEDLDDLEVLRNSPLDALEAISMNFTIGQRNAFRVGLSKIRRDIQLHTGATSEAVRLKQLDMEMARIKGNHEIEISKIEKLSTMHKDTLLAQMEAHKHDTFKEMVNASKLVKGGNITRERGWFFNTVTNESEGDEEHGLKSISADTLTSMKALGYKE